MHLRELVGAGPAAMSTEEFKERLDWATKWHKKQEKKAKSNKRRRTEKLVDSLTNDERQALASMLGGGNG